MSRDFKELSFVTLSKLSEFSNCDSLMGFVSKINGDYGIKGLHNLQLTLIFLDKSADVRVWWIKSFERMLNSHLRKSQRDALKMFEGKTDCITDCHKWMLLQTFLMATKFEEFLNERYNKGENEFIEKVDNLNK